MNWQILYAIMAKSKAKYPFFEGNFSYTYHGNSRIARYMTKSRVGWGRRAVEMRANKTQFDKFENDEIGLNEIFREFKGPEALDKIKEDVLVSGVGFLALSGDRIMPFTGLEATGNYDWREQNLKDGVAIFREQTKKDYQDIQCPDSYMVFNANETIVYEKSEGETKYPNHTGRPLMTLLTHKSTTKQPFGHSVISTPARDAIIDASRTTYEAMIAGHHYNSKVDVILGVDIETSVEKIEMSTGEALKIGTNEQGTIPQIAQFAQHAMAPFNDSILLAARNFCSETKLNLSNLSISVNAPQSPEALEIVGDDLRDDIVEWQKEIGDQIKYFAVTLWMYKNGVDELDDNMKQKIDAIKVAWMPIFKGDVSKFGDGLNKIAANAPGIVRQRSIWRGLGLTSDEIDDVIKSLNENK